MGDPKKQRIKYSTPEHPWRETRIKEEKALTKEYAFKNRTEIWKMKSILRNFKLQAKKIIATKTLKQSEKEKMQMMQKLARLGLLPEGAALESVLALTLNDILERRLQTLVFRKGMANSMKQARQFISHGHITVNGEKITSPSYLVRKDEEATIAFAPNSALASEEHPERLVLQKKKEAIKVIEAKKEERKKEEKKTKEEKENIDKKEENKSEEKKEAKPGKENTKEKRKTIEEKAKLEKKEKTKNKDSKESTKEVVKEEGKSG